MVREETERKVAKLSEKNSEVLTNLINESFDKRLENVDDYLDWYYSLPADYERLASMITGSAEEFVTDQFTAHIENGIDDSAIDEQLSVTPPRSTNIARMRRRSSPRMKWMTYPNG